MVTPRFTERRGAGRLRPASAVLLALACAGCATAEVPHAAARDLLDADAGLVEDAHPDEPAAPPQGDALPSRDVASTPDAAPTGTVPCTSLPLCDGFESVASGAAPDPAIWSISQPDCSGTGTLAVDDSEAHSGKHSLKVNGGGGYCDHVFIVNANVIGALGPQIYTRLFVRVGAVLGAGHVTFLAMKDTADMGSDVRMGGQDMVLMYNRQSDDATLPVMSPTGTGESVALTADAWTCIESHFDETAGTIDTWVDGKEIAGLVENGTPTPDVSTQWLSDAGWRPTLSDFRIGWESYSGQTMTLWFDDVALAAQRIGCDL
jgi:hypothetical protein